MLWLVVILSLLNCAGLSLLIWLAHSHLLILQRLERTLGHWAIPQNETPTPIPVPGTMFLPSDAEVARREKAMQSESRQRADTIRGRRRHG